MIVNPDHMSQAAVDDTLTLLESRRYSGVISPHGWMDPGNWPRLWKLGGVAFPGHSSASDYVKEWRKFRPRGTPYDFGWGYGADLGGLSHQPDAAADGGITYPFRSYDRRVTFQRQRTGERTFDYNKEGVAQYGLYADWFEDLRRLGGNALARDMWDGAEAYLEMWERAQGIPTRDCAISHGALSSRGLARVRLGATWESLLRRAGQPQQRSRAWSWCVKGEHNLHAADVAVLEQRRQGRARREHRPRSLGRRHRGRLRRSRPALGNHRSPRRAVDPDLRRPPRPGPRRGRDDPVAGAPSSRAAVGDRPSALGEGDPGPARLRPERRAGGHPRGADRPDALRLERSQAQRRVCLPLQSERAGNVGPTSPRWRP